MYYRHEYKFNVTDAQLALIRNRLIGVCSSDRFQKDDYYTITSLYFDDYVDSCSRENIDGVGIRSKYRIRIYNNKPDIIKLEKKSKVAGMTSKISQTISLDQCKEFMREEYFFDKDLNNSEIGREMIIKGMKPKSIVQYDRTAFVYGPGNVRITFDRNIGGSPRIMDFLNEKIEVIPLITDNTHILEVKFDEFLPKYLEDLLNIGSLQKQSFSKYGMSRHFY